jgi:hypothetical protein
MGDEVGVDQGDPERAEPVGDVVLPLPMPRSGRPRGGGAPPGGGGRVGGVGCRGGGGRRARGLARGGVGSVTVGRDGAPPGRAGGSGEPKYAAIGRPK